MQAGDRVKLDWTRTDITNYTAIMTVAQYAELIGMPVSKLLEYDSPNDAIDDGTLNLADELASVEDDGNATENGYECQRDDMAAWWWKREPKV